MASDTEATNAIDQDLIKLAYSMAIDRKRFEEMFILLSDKFDDLSNDVPQFDQISSPDFVKLETHFEHAQSLMDAQGREMDTATHSMKVIDADNHPSMLIEPDGRVFYANKPAIEIFGVRKGQYLKDQMFEHGHHQNFMNNLRRMKDFEPNKIISIFGMSNVNDQDNDEIIKIALTKAHTANGDIMAHISAINISWMDSTGRGFKSLFNLTPVEIEITKAVVTGVSLNNLAEKRGRSIGTVRNQTKMLLAKLNLRSQTELACLYSGFAQYDGNLVSRPLDPQSTGYAAVQKMLLRDNGRMLDYRTAGPANGRNIILVPSLLGGMAITKKLHDALHQHNIRLIMPWRPGVGDSGIDGKPSKKSFIKHSEDIAAMLNDLKIGQAPIIGYVTGAHYAIAAGQYIQDRISHIINLNGIVPSAHGPHLNLIDKRERTRMFLLRTTPKIGRMVIQAAMRLVDSGYDLEFISAHLRNSPLDLKTADEDEVKHLFRADFRQITKYGYDGLINDLILSAMDWSYLIEQSPYPIHNLVGAHNIDFTPEVIQTYAQSIDNYNVEIIDNAGHLALYQQPDIIFDRIKAIID